MGCSSPEYAPVSGVVTYKGAPLEGATVTFDPTSGKKPSYGKTDATGRYSVMVAGVRDQPGAALGEHRVKVTAISESAPGQAADSDLGSLARIGFEPKIRYLVPPRYDDFNTSGLTFTVPPGGSSAANFALVD